MKSFFIRTFGCKTNQYESQLIKELLSLKGEKVVDDYCEADCVVINSCAVTQPAERDVFKFIRRVQNESKQTKKILVIGCYADYIKNNNLYSKFFERLSVDIQVEFLGNKEKYEFIEPNICESEKNITKFFGIKRAYVKIQDGCDNFCSYCVVPYLRTKLVSRAKQSIFQEIEQLIRNNYNELYLVGTNIGKYNCDGDLVDLSEDILLNFPEVTLIFSSLNPSDFNYKFFNFLEKYKTRIFPHFHISLQSPIDKVLEDMGRRYNYSDFLEIINKLRKIIPYVILSADVIVGYPLETKEDFMVAKELLKKLNLNWYHIFPYSPRLGTKSYKKYGNFSWSDVKARVRELKVVNEILKEDYFKSMCKVK